MSVNSFLISIISTDDNHEENIGYLMSQAKRIRIISPYVTKYGIDFVLKNASEEAEIELITELSISGIMGGSQSPCALKGLLNSPNAEVYYYTSNLHSKLYILDENIFVTSANLTKGGLVLNMESGLTVNSYLKDKITGSLKDRMWCEITAYWDELIKKAVYLDDEEISLWIAKEDELQERKKELKELIGKHTAEMPRRDYKNFDRPLEGSDEDETAESWIIDNLYED